MELTAESRDAISGAARPPQNSSILRQQSLGGRSYPARHHFISQKHFRFAGEMLRRFLCQIILADPVEQWLATANLIEL